MGLKIEIGISQENLHIGVQPPLTAEQLEMLQAERRTDPQLPETFNLVTPDHGDQFSEGCIPKSDVSFNNDNELTQHLLRVAHRVGRLLAGDGAGVKVNPRPQHASRGLFSDGTDKSVVK